MKALFANADYGLMGLLYFFVIFVGIAIWVFHPKHKNDIEALKNIPLNEDEDGSKSE